MAYSSLLLFSSSASIYTSGDYVELPLDDSDLETIYSAQDILDIANDDGNRVAQTATDEYAIHQAKVNTIHNLANIKWNGRSDLSCSLSTVYLQIYNQNTTSWDTLASDGTTGADTDFDLTATGLDLTDYKNNSNFICCRVFQKAQ